MASGDSDFLMKCSVASAGINAVLNFILIPHYGMIGAAAASSASFASIEVLMTLRTWRAQHMHPFTPMYRRLSLIGAVLVVVMLAAREMLPLSGASWEYAAFMIVYFVAIRSAKVLDEKEMDMVNGIKKAIMQNISTLLPQALKTLGY
jgi:O-antigen/teichoic acid export membrane protein